MQTQIITHRRLKPCLESARQNNDQVVCGIQNEGTGYKYASFATQESFANFVLNHPEGKYANELLGRQGTHTYIDIDAKCTLEQLQWKTKDEFVTAFTAFMKAAFQKYFGIKLKTKQFRWSDSTRPEKVSFHLCIALEDFFLEG